MLYTAISLLLVPSLLVSATPVEKRATTCPAGSYPFTIKGGNNVATGCTQCTGLTWAAAGATSCSNCPALPIGFSACDHTNGKPSTCSSGFSINAAATMCSACSPGFWTVQDNTSNTCKACGPLMASCTDLMNPSDHTFTHIATALSCVSGAGMIRDTHYSLDYPPQACVSCPSGTFSTGVGPCRPCLAGIGALCSNSTGVTKSCLAGFSYNVTANATSSCTSCGLNAFVPASTLASKCTNCTTSNSCNSTTGAALTCPAMSFLSARNDSATPPVVCTPYTCPLGAICDSSTGKPSTCISGWAGVNTTLATTGCNNCSASNSYKSSNGTVCLGCSAFSTACNPLTGDVLACKLGYSVATARNGTQPLGCRIVCPVGQTIDATGYGCIDCSLAANFKNPICLGPMCSNLRSTGFVF